MRELRAIGLGLKWLVIAVTATVALCAGVVTILEWTGVTKEEALTFVVQHLGSVLAYALLCILALAYVWVLICPMPRLMAWVARTLVRQGRKIASKIRKRKSLKSRRSEVAWLWLRGLSDHEVRTWISHLSPGDSAPLARPSDDGFQHVAEWLWDDAKPCEYIRVPVLIPSSQTAPYPIAAGVDLYAEAAAEGSSLTLCIADRGTAKLYYGDEMVHEADGFDMGHWHILTLWLKNGTFWASVDSMVWGPYPVDDGGTIRWPDPMRPRLRVWAKHGAPVAAFGLPESW